MSDEITSTDEPALRVVKGDPTPEELAAVVAVVAARAAAPVPAPTSSTPSTWADPGARHRGTHRPGPDAWRRSSSR